MTIKHRIILILVQMRMKLRIILMKFGIDGFKPAIKLLILLRSKLHYQLRLLIIRSSDRPSSHLENIIDLVAIYLTSPHFLDKSMRTNLLRDPNCSVLSNNEMDRFLSDYEKNKDAIDQIVNTEGKSEFITETVAIYFQTESFINGRLRNHIAQEIYMKLAMQYNPYVQNLDANAIFSLLRATRKELRIFKQRASDQNAIRISLSSQHITGLLSIASALFLVSGYFYSRIFLGAFDIDVKHYYSLSDYIGTSIEGIQHAVIAAVAAFVGGFIGVHDKSRTPDSQIERVNAQDARMYWFTVVLFGISTIVGYFRDFIYFYQQLVFVIWLLSVKPIDWMISRYFVEKSWLIWRFSIQFILIFSLYLFASAKSEIYRIEHGNIDNIKHYDLVFKDAVDFESDNTVLLASSSRYVFLRDGVSGEVFIVPTSQIESISVRQR